ncbi:hypothetical protein NMG60_11020868 [Bertholletia excelsa]
MESLGLGFSNMSNTVRKKRSNSSRRPRNDSQPFIEWHDNSSLSSTPPSENASRTSSDDTSGYGTNSWKKELNLNQCSSRASSTNLLEVENALNINNDDVGCTEFTVPLIKGRSEWKHNGVDFKRCREGVLSPANWKGATKIKEGPELQTLEQKSGRTSGSHSSGPSMQSEVASDGLESDTKVKKVKLKVGGATRTIQSKATSATVSIRASSSTKSSRFSDTPRPWQELIVLEKSDGDHSSSPERVSDLQGVPWKGSRSGFSVINVNSSKGKTPEESISDEPLRKSKRISKRRLLNEGFDDEDDDEELRYLEKLKTSKVPKDYSAEYDDDNEEGIKKHSKISKASKRNVDGGYDMDARDFGSSGSSKDPAKKSRSGRASEDTDYVIEEDPTSDGEPGTKRKKQRKELIDVMRDSKRELVITTRQRALQTGKDNSCSSGASLIEFPNGLPPAPPRKQKEKLSEVEQQLKKAEAAERRRMQVEKAAQESQAEAIRKILGQDSSRKRREEKIKKRQEELAQERAANAMTLASDTVRWVMGPSGTVVTFPNEMGFPSIFEPKASSYPPPREKCAGPSCTNPYKYRDSESKLPLCSLQCYKAVREKMLPVSAC